MSITIDDLTFGVEFEVLLPPRDPERQGDRGRAALAQHLSASGIDTQAEEYNHRLRPHWKITTDSSIGYANAEIVSPILQGEAGLEQVKRLCRLIDDWGCRVNRDCGHHVHVGVRDRFGRQIGFFKELVKTYAKFTSVIDQLVAPSRRGRANNFCQPVRYTDEADRATTLDQLARISVGGSRSVTVNFYDAFSRHGTVEFRQHQGTINGEKSANWVRFCLRMVVHAAKNTEPVGSQPPRSIDRPNRRWVEGIPVVRDLEAAPLIRGDELPSRQRPSQLRNLVIRGIAPTNPRRSGTQRHANWEHYVVGETVEQFVRRGGRIDIARHDVAEGYVRIASIVDAPIITPAVRGYFEDIAPEPMPEPVATPVFERPATDAAPATLDGLLELIGASDAERSYFEERMMELNP